MSTSLTALTDGLDDLLDCAAGVALPKAESKRQEVTFVGAQFVWVYRSNLAHVDDRNTKTNEEIYQPWCARSAYPYKVLATFWNEVEGAASARTAADWSSLLHLTP